MQLIEAYFWRPTKYWHIKGSEKSSRKETCLTLFNVDFPEFSETRLLLCNILVHIREIVIYVIYHLKYILKCSISLFRNKTVCLNFSHISCCSAVCSVQITSFFFSFFFFWDTDGLFIITINGTWIHSKKKPVNYNKATFIDYNVLFRNQQRNETPNSYTQTLKSLHLALEITHRLKR